MDFFNVLTMTILVPPRYYTGTDFHIETILDSFDISIYRNTGDLKIAHASSTTVYFLSIGKEHNSTITAYTHTQLA